MLEMPYWYSSSSGGTSYEKLCLTSSQHCRIPLAHVLTFKYAIRGTVIGGVWHTFSEQ